MGEDLLGRDGKRLGEVERLVIDEPAHRVTHVVVRGRLVGLARLRDAGPDGLACDLDRKGLERLPEAHPELVTAPGGHWHPPSGYAVEHFLRLANALVGQAPYTPPVEAELDLESIPEIKEGSPVWSGRERLGEVAGLVTDDSGAVRELVLSRGHLRHRVRVPAGRVIEVVGTNVHVDLDRRELERLPPEAG